MENSKKKFRIFISFLPFFFCLCNGAITPHSGDEYRPVLDSFIRAFNLKDSKALSGLYHSQYFRVDWKGGIIVADMENPQPPLFFSMGFEKTSWRHAVLDSAEVVQRSKSKVHVTANIDLYNEKENKIERHKTIFMINEIEGKWGIYGISFFKTNKVF